MIRILLLEVNVKLDKAIPISTSYVMSHLRPWKADNDGRLLEESIIDIFSEYKYFEFI